MSNNDLQVLIETLIDKHSITQVLQTVVSICHEKSEHIFESYNDRVLAHKWASAGHAISMAIKRIPV